MAKIRDYAVTIEAAAVASSVLEMPTHETGDLLLIFFNKDSTAGGPSLPSGWTSLQSQSSAGAFGQVYGKRATSSAEAVTLSYTSETSITLVLSVKNCYGTTVADAVSNSNVSGSDDSTLPLTGGTITPGYNNSLILSFLSTDIGIGPMSLPGWVNIFGGDTGANSLCVSYTYQKTAAAITHPGYWGITQDDSRAFMVVVRDDGNETEVDPYVDVATVPAVLITPFTTATTAAATIAAEKGTWVAVSPMDITTLNSKTFTYAASAAVADTGYNPFRGTKRVTAVSSKTVLYGSELRLTAAQDLTGNSGVIFGMYRFTSPRDYLDLGKASTGGHMIGLADASNNHRFWTIAAQLSLSTLPAAMANYAIQVSNTDSDYVTSGSPDMSAVNDVYHANASYYAASLVEMCDLWLLNTTVVAGGTSANPINFLDIIYAVNNGSGYIPLMQQQGSAATIWGRVQIGGADPIHCLVNLRTFQWPTKADGIDFLDFHVANNVMGMEFYGKSGDTIKFTNCVFTSDSAYYWKFHTSHASLGTSLDFSGTSVVMATVTLRSTVALNRTTFINCSSFTQNNAVLDECNLSNTKITADNPADISDCAFTSSGTGYAMEITAAGTYSFVGNTFSGYAASDGSTGNEAIYNNSGGAVTLNISGGGSTPSIRNGSGASTTVNNNAVLTISGLVTGSDVVIYTAGTTTVLDDSQENSGTTFQYQYPVADAGDSIDVGVFLAGYIPFYIRGYVLAATNASLPAAQVVDRAYLT